MNVYWSLFALFCCVMKKAAWGEKKHDLPSLGEICRYTTNEQVAGFLIANELIDNQTGNYCGKVYKYERSSKEKPPCSGTLTVQGPFSQHPNKMYWRCWKCKRTTSIFHGTLMDKFNIPLPQMLQTLYLSMLYIPVSTFMDFFHSFPRH